VVATAGRLARIMLSLVAAVATLTLLVFVHELGHFIVARRLGIRVERFSIGFGPPLYERRIGETDFRVAAIPLGGYVKMLGDTPDAEVDEAEQARAFLAQPPWKRAAVAVAGPAANLAAPVLLFAAVFMAGVPTLRPLIGEVVPDSPAARAGVEIGDEIVAMDGEPVASWEAVSHHYTAHPTDPVTVIVRRHGEEVRVVVEPPVPPADGEATPPAEVATRGAYLVFPSLVGAVQPEMPAAAAGIEPGDRVVAIDGEPVGSWKVMARIIRDHPETPLRFTLRRGEQEVEIEVVPKAVPNPDAASAGEPETIGRVGIATSDPPPELFTLHRLGPLAALGAGYHRTVEVGVAIVSGIGQLFRHEVSTQSLGGPIMIVQMAGQQAKRGLSDWLFFVAVISLNLGILNLLPIPILDGGHLLICAVEGILRRPANPRILERAQQLGLALLLTLMLFATYNDVMRWMGVYPMP